MWVRSYSKVYSGVTKEAIWELWTDIDHWPLWNPGLDASKLEGSFSVGARFMLKPKGKCPVTLELVEVEPFKKFTDCSKFLGAKMFGTHEVEERSEGLQLTTTLTMTGPLACLWVKLVGQRVADKLPQQTDALVKLAKEKQRIQVS